MKTTHYDRKYHEQKNYWGNEISKMALSIMDYFPPENERPKILEIGCGEGTNAVFFAKNGYAITAFDLSKTAIEKTNVAAEQAEVEIATFVADVNDYVPAEEFDIIFSSGTLQYLLPEKRQSFIQSIKNCTSAGGINVLHTFVWKSFIAQPPDAEDSEFLWNSGDLLSFYQDWRVDQFLEEIKNCNSSDVSHEHSHNRIWTRKL